jgi:hypothetical protein
MMEETDDEIYPSIAQILLLILSMLVICILCANLIMIGVDLMLMRQQFCERNSPKIYIGFAYYFHGPPMSKSV